MATVFIDGFDKYGPLGYDLTAVMTSGEWTTAAGVLVGAPLSATGYSVLCNAGGNASITFGTNYPTLILGCRFQSNLANGMYWEFRDSGTPQMSVVVTAGGQIQVWRAVADFLIGTASATITANSTHYLEIQATFHNTAGAVQVWLDGVSVLGPLTSQNTRTSANNSANQIYMIASGSDVCYVDDMYVFDTTGGVNNAPLLTSPRIETTFPVSDAQQQFTVGPSVVGNYSQQTTITASADFPANSFQLIKFTPTCNQTINSVSGVTRFTVGSLNFNAIIYADSGGVPGALLNSGPPNVGVTAFTVATGNLTTPQSLTAGTQYWIGFIVDTDTNWYVTDASISGLGANRTYGSGAPSSAGAMTAAQNFEFWGNCTAETTSYTQEAHLPPTGSLAYNSSSTPGQEDLFGFTPLITAPTAIYTVKVSAFVQRSDTGTRTVDLRMKSGAMDSAGSHAGQTPANSFGYLSSYFDTDPNTSAAWGTSGLNAATTGYKIAS